MSALGELLDHLGAVRTLTRACLAVAERSAKQVVDDRVALQARRLLAATDEPIARIGRRLGFPEPTNFGRFFTREVGVSPGAFRAAAEEPLTARPDLGAGRTSGHRPGPANHEIGSAGRVVRPRPPADAPADRRPA